LQLTSLTVWKFFLLTALLLVGSLKAHAEINLIKYQFGSDNETDIPTVYWAKPGSKAVIIFIPGGGGSFGLTKKTDPQPNWVLADLFRGSQAAVDLVFMDSHTSLQANFGDPYSRWSARREARHLDQIKATVSYYAKKTGKPVFLFGHSNGSLSIAEFLKHSPDHQKLLGGIILSGSRNETEISGVISLPVLVLHHRKDPNRWTMPESAEKLFLSIQKNNARLTDLAWVDGGKDVSGGDPTHTGRHMYHEATDEAAGLIWRFVAKSI